MATSGSQDHASGTTAYPPTGDIRGRISLSVATVRRVWSKKSPAGAGLDVLACVLLFGKHRVLQDAQTGNL